MATTITDEELFQYDMLKTLDSTSNTGGTLFLHDGKVYKLFFNDFSKQIEYLKSIPRHPHVLPILEELIPEWESDFKSGYCTEYKENAKTFFESFNDHLPYVEKEKYIKQIFSAIQFLHQYFVIGDIHGDNFFIHEGNAYVYDLEYARKLSDKKRAIKCKYSVSPLERFYATTYTDLIKTYIECYSFLLEKDLSYFIQFMGYKKFASILLNTPLPKEMLHFLQNSLQMLKERKCIEEMYQPDMYMNEEILNAKKELKKTLERL